MMKDETELIITRELFVETMDAIERQVRHDSKCADAFRTILPNDHTSVYDNHHLSNAITKLLQLAMKDDHEHSWIEYFMWELDFGKSYTNGAVMVDNQPYDLSTASLLFGLLIKNLNL